MMRTSSTSRTRPWGRPGLGATVGSGCTRRDYTDARRGRPRRNGNDRIRCPGRGGQGTSPRCRQACGRRCPNSPERSRPRAAFARESAPDVLPPQPGAGAPALSRRVPRSGAPSRREQRSARPAPKPVRSEGDVTRSLPVRDSVPAHRGGRALDPAATMDVPPRSGASRQDTRRGTPWHC